MYVTRGSRFITKKKGRMKDSMRRKEGRDRQRFGRGRGKMDGCKEQGKVDI